MSETWVIGEGQETPPPNPGSDEALALGCTCPALDNAHGAGCRCRRVMAVRRSGSRLAVRFMRKHERKGAARKAGETIAAAQERGSAVALSRADENDLAREGRGRSPARAETSGVGGPKRVVVRAARFRSWGIRVTTGSGVDRAVDRFLLGRFGQVGSVPPFLAGCVTMLFATRREAREACRVGSTPRGSRSDGFFWALSPVRVAIMIDEVAP